MFLPATHTPGPNGKKKALSVGIGYNGELDGTHKDSLELKELLIDLYNYKECDVVLMLDDDDETSDLYPTYDNVIREMENLVRDAQPGDHFVFHFAGHGSQTENFDHTEVDGMDEVLCTVDGGIIDDDIRRILVNPLPPGSSLIAIFDSCHSGTMLDLENYDYDYDKIWKPDDGAFRLRSSSVASHGKSVYLHESNPANICSEASGKPGSIDVQFSYSEHPYREGSGPKSVSSKMSLSVNVDSVLFPSIDQCASPLERTRTSTTEDISSLPPKPQVFSLSASRDSETIWEGMNGRTMTKALIDILRDNPHPPLENLMDRIREKLYTAALELHQNPEWELKYQHYKEEVDHEIAEYPTAQLGSLGSLEMVMDSPFDI